MKKIMLNQDNFTIVDDDDYAFLMQWKWGLCNKYAARKQYFGYDENKKKITKNIYLHRVINATPDGFETDHINGDKLDNRKSNLRTASSSQNKMNRSHGSGSSVYKGTSWNKRQKKWASNIKIGKKQTFIGYFDCEEDAALAYNFYAAKEYGQFAKLNFCGVSK